MNIHDCISTLFLCNLQYDMAVYYYHNTVEEASV